MHLTPEQRALGKDNFHSVLSIRRREFLEGLVGSGVGVGIGFGWKYFGYDKSLADPVRVGVIGTGDEGNVLIGAHNPEFVNIVAIADIRPSSRHRAFHGDHSSPGALEARPGLKARLKTKLMAENGWKDYDPALETAADEAIQGVKVYEGEYSELLADADVEAVIIALPLHMHAKAAIDAMRAGKHVLTEKLMGHSVAECKEMARVADETRTLLATGHQRHYSTLYDNGVDLIRSGVLGKIHHIRAQWHRGNLPGSDSWSPRLPSEWQEIASAIQNRRKEADWTPYDRQVMALASDSDINPADYGYVDRAVTIGNGDLSESYELQGIEELIRWRLWNRTGGGLMAELGSHQLDAASIFLTAMREQGAPKARPLTVTAYGHRSLFEANRDVEDHVHCMYDYGNPDYDPADPKHYQDKTIVSYSSINGNPYGGYGEVVMGTKGTLVLEREQETMLFRQGDVGTRVTVEESGNALVPTTTDSPSPSEEAQSVAAHLSKPSRGYTEEIEHWAWCIRNRAPENKPRCHPEVALADAVIALTTNVAIRSTDPAKKQIHFKDEWFDIASDETPEGSAPDLGKYA